MNTKPFRLLLNLQHEVIHFVSTLMSVTINAIFEAEEKSFL